MSTNGVIEVRITQLDEISQVAGSGADRISLGQEGCITKAPTFGEIARFGNIMRSIELQSGLVVPMAWPRSEMQVSDMIKAAIDAGINEIVVNDWGTLLNAESKSSLVAGLALTRSQLATSEDEPRDQRIDGSIVSMAAAFGMAGIEVDQAVAIQHEFGSTLFRTILGHEPLGWSRSCPTLRLMAPGESPSQKCKTFCNKPMELTATSRWRLVDGKREVLPAGVHAPQVKVWGNGIYREMPCNYDRYSRYLVIDQRRHNNDIVSAVKHAQHILKSKNYR